MALGSSGLGFGDAGGGGGGTVMGSGTLNYVPKWTPDGTTLGDSLIYDSGAGVAIGTTTITGLFNVSGGMSYFKGADSTSNNFVAKFDSSSAAVMYFRNDGHWGNSNTGLTDRWSDLRHTGNVGQGYVRSFSRNASGNLDGYLIYTTVQSGNSTTAMRLIPGDTGNQVSEGLVSTGGTGNQSWGVRGNGGNALISVGVQGSVTIGGSSYAAAVLGSASGTAGTGGVSYAVWGNHTGTAAVNKYGGYFDSSGANGTNVGGYFRAVNGGTNYAIVTAGGNSGFGTVTPTAMAHVVGVDSTSSNFAAKFDNSSNSPIAYFRDDERVGIRTSNPLATVHIAGKSGDDPLRIYSASYGAPIFTAGNTGKITEQIYGDWAHSISSTSNSSISGISAGLGIDTGSTTGAATALVGVYSQVLNSNALTGTTTANGIRGYVLGGSNIANAIGCYGLARQGSGYSAGGYFQADDNSPINYGVYGEGQYSPTTNYGGYFIALNTNPSSTATTTHGVRAIANNYKDSGTVYGAYITATNTNLAASGVIYGLYVAATTSNGTSTNYAIVTNGGNVGIGTTTPSAQALMELSSTTQALLIMRMTSTQASAITAADGMILYATDTNGTFTSVGFWGYENGAWVKL